MDIGVSANPFRNARGIFNEFVLVAGECVASFANEKVPCQHLAFCSEYHSIG